MTIECWELISLMLITSGFVGLAGALYYTNKSIRLIDKILKDLKRMHSDYRND